MGRSRPSQINARSRAILAFNSYTLYRRTAFLQQAVIGPATTGLLPTGRNIQVRMVVSVLPAAKLTKSLEALTHCLTPFVRA